MAAVFSACAQQAPLQSPAVSDNMARQVTAMDVTSPAFQDGGRIPVKYTADGDDMSPAINWSHAPEGTGQFVLICDDPDAPSGTFTHWVIYGIYGNKTGLPEGVPQIEELDDRSMQGVNSFGKIGYGGPAPPKGKPHRYIFKLYALDARMDLPAGIAKDKLLKAMEGHVIAEGTLTGLYGR